MLNSSALDYFKKQTIKYFYPKYKPINVSANTIKRNSMYQKIWLMEPQYKVVFNQCVLVVFAPIELKEYFSFYFVNKFFELGLKEQDCFNILPTKHKFERIKYNGNYLVLNLEKYCQCNKYKDAVKYAINMGYVDDLLL